jgi:hypothetical protein
VLVRLVRLGRLVGLYDVGHLDVDILMVIVMWIRHFDGQNFDAGILIVGNADLTF